MPHPEKEMHGKIGTDGHLHLLRAGRFKRQLCPYTANACGDWCPLFYELVQRGEGPVTDLHEAIICCGQPMTSIVIDADDRPGRKD